VLACGISAALSPLRFGRLLQQRGGLFAQVLVKQVNLLLY